MYNQIFGKKSRVDWDGAFISENLYLQRVVRVGSNYRQKSLEQNSHMNTKWAEVSVIIC